jgi:hypothetical protein
VQQLVVSGRRVADPELAQRPLVEPPRGEVLARRRRLVGVPQVADVERRRALEQLVQALAHPPALGLGRVLLDRLELHPVAVREVLERRLEVEALGHLDEPERVPALAAPEAVEELLAGVDPERRGPLVVERAQALVAVDPSAAQLGARADEVDHVDRLAHALLGVVGVADRHDAGT